MRFLDNINRRDFFNWGIRGIGATAFTSLLASNTKTHAGLKHNTFPNFTPRAKRAIHISLVGGMSQLDS